LYGIDAASVFAACCLDPKPGDAVLDLCCAPGAKLCTLCDAVQPDGEVIGVDIAEQRLAACRTVLKKYGISNARLSLGSGTSWDPSEAQWLDLDPPRGRGQRGRKRRFAAAAAAAAGCAGDCHPGAEESQMAAAADSGGPPPGPALFDRVLVDAECTHDGSIRHIEKYRTQWGWDTLGERVPWVRQDGLYDLQAALLTNGFRLLRAGGTLVYSTCSLCRRQNEDVVAEFLEREPAAVLTPLPEYLYLPAEAARASGEVASAPARPSLLESQRPLGKGARYCTARFDPSSSGTSGLFIACITRRPLPTSK